jgi:protein phosphatase
MTVVYAYKSHTGLVPTHNEDYVWVDGEKNIFIVADGMGGHESGDVASRLAATTIGKAIGDGLKEEALSRTAMQNLMTEAIERANQTVWEASGEAEQKRRMGATIVVAVVRPPTTYIAHAGDARIYLVRGTTMTRLTQDDSWIAHLIAEGIISEAESKHNRLAHVITKAIGQGSPVEAAFAEVPVQAGDWLLLCSDGLWNMVDDDQILAELQKAKGDPAPLVESLIRAAIEAGGKDNISVIALKVS